jgi:hypothetical protein
MISDLNKHGACRFSLAVNPHRRFGAIFLEVDGSGQDMPSSTIEYAEGQLQRPIRGLRPSISACSLRRRPISMHTCSRYRKTVPPKGIGDRFCIGRQQSYRGTGYRGAEWINDPSGQNGRSEDGRAGYEDDT